MEQTNHMNNSLQTLSKSEAMLQCKCPRCRKGNMFKFSAFNLKKFMEMNSTCDHCKLRYEVEPGFFWGAMYISYAITVLIMLVVGASILLIFGSKAGFWGYIIPILSSLILFMPFTFRYARVLMLYWFSPIKFENDEQ